MWVEMLTAIPGLVAALLLGYVYWKYHGAPADSSPRERPSPPVARLRLSNRTILKILIALTALLGVSGYVSIPLGYDGIRDGLLLLHTVGGGFLVLVLVAFIIPRAAGMGGIVRSSRQPTANFGRSQDRRTVLAFWGIVTLGLGLVGTVLAVLSTGVSQTEQSGLINLHSLAGFLFMLMLGLFGRQMTPPS